MAADTPTKADSGSREENLLASPIHTHLAEVVCSGQISSESGLPKASIKLMPWTWPHLVAFLVNKYAGGRAVLDGDDIKDLPRHRLKDDMVRSNSLVFEGVEVAAEKTEKPTPG